MTPEEEMTLIFGAIEEYAKLNDLIAEEVIDIFNEGLLQFHNVPLISPLIEDSIPISIRKENIEKLREKKSDLQETLKWVPACERGKRDEILDEILEINKKLECESRKVQTK